MARNRAILAAAAFVLSGASSAALACGPTYFDAHHGHRDFLLGHRAYTFYYFLYYPNDTTRNRVLRGRKAFEKAEKHEIRREYTEALKLYREALRELNGFSTDYERIRSAQDRADLLGSLKTGDDYALIRSYLTARDRKQANVLRGLVDKECFVSDNAAYALAVLAKDADTFAGFSKKYPGSEKCDAAAYRTARCMMDTDKKKALAMYAKYLEDYPEGTYRAEAMGWQAYLIPRVEDHLEEGERWQKALKIYLRIIGDRSLHSMFRAAVHSLDYGKLHGNIPPEAVENPNHLSGLVFAMNRGGRHYWRRRPGFPKETFEKVLKLARDRLNRRHLLAMPPDTLGKLSRSYFLLRDPKSAERIARLALQKGGDSLALYVLGRMHAEEGKPSKAESYFGKLARRDARYKGIADLGLRIGAAYEKKGRMKDALRMYMRVGSKMDVDLLTDGEMSTGDLADFTRVHLTLEPVGGSEHGWSWNGRWNSERVVRDLMPYLRARLGVRYAREGQLEKAVRYLDAEKERKDVVAKLIELEAAVAKAGEGEKPSAIYALGAYWYHHGRRAVYNGSSWQRFYVRIPYRASEEDWKKLEKDPDWPRREKALVGMNNYMHALPYFLEVAKKYPDSPEAPKALYSAALCYYWSSGCTRYMYYWPKRAKRDGFMQKGNELMLQIPEKYPDHELARSEWVRERLQVSR
jgi:TolA-binding protein